MELGFTPENLKSIMSEHDLSNPYLADYLKVHKQQVTRWRTGESTMPHPQWLKLLEHVQKKPQKWLCIFEKVGIEYICCVIAKDKNEALEKAKLKVQDFGITYRVIKIIAFDDIDENWDA